MTNGIIKSFKVAAKKRAIKKAAKKVVKKTVKKNNAGRKKYVPSDEHFETCRTGARKGLNYSEISKAIGISLKTFQRNIDLFRPHLKKGLSESDDKNCEQVESALLKRCLGYETTETHSEKRVNANGETLFMAKREVKRFHPPSDVAIFFFLCNRAGERWQSINKPVVDEEKSKGEIQGWFDMMRNQYNKMTK